MPPLLRNRHRAEEQHRARLKRQIARDLGDDTSKQKPGSLPGDPEALRGLPMVNVHGGRGGAIRGTRPGASLG